MTTITIHLSHDPDIVDDVINSYPSINIDLNSSPYKTPITGPKSSLVPFLLDYYYWDHDMVTLNHNQITQPDIYAYLRSQHN